MLVQEIQNQPTRPRTRKLSNGQVEFTLRKGNNHGQISIVARCNVDQFEDFHKQFWVQQWLNK